MELASLHMYIKSTSTGGMINIDHLLMLWMVWWKTSDLPKGKKTSAQLRRTKEKRPKQAQWSKKALSVSLC